MYWNTKCKTKRLNNLKLNISIISNAYFAEKKACNRDSQDVMETRGRDIHYRARMAGVMKTNKTFPKTHRNSFCGRYLFVLFLNSFLLT